MAYRIKILRGSGTEKSAWQTFLTELNGDSSVASVLEELNSRTELRDTDGNLAEPIAWDCACLEKKCGACAMVICGKPRLACACKLKDVLRCGEITLEPLRKFPRLRDLQVDRQKIFDDLREMELWLDREVDLEDEKQRSLHYRASSCLMCGLCLEVCPNCTPKGTFAGALSAAATFRAFEQSAPGAHREQMRKAYTEHFFKDCAKSLSCQDACPMQLPIEKLLVKTNAAAIWHRGEKE